MNKLSIKMKLTLWYTLFMMVLFGVVFVFLYYLTRHTVQTNTQNQLRSVVNEALAEIEYGRGGLEFEDDIGFFDRGVYLVAYDDDEKMQILYGQEPASFQADVPLTLDTIQTMTIEGQQWYIYDNAMIVGNYGEVWIRGITSFSERQIVINNILQWLGIIFPIVILLVATLGYLISKKALMPINKMISVAQGISKGQDLTKRIGLEGKQWDEIHQLSTIFDEMFHRLQSAFENEKQFIFDASHELKTPIAVIISYCEYLISQEKLESKAREDIQIVLQQAQKMSRLITQLLLLSKSEYTLQIENVNSSELLSVVAEEQQMFAEEKDIVIHTHIAENLMIEADETMLIRIFMNLIKNAIAYGKQNGNVYIYLEEKEGSLHGRIQDDGIGISKEHLDKIWNRFYQVESARSNKQDAGMGLGLSMVKWMIDAHKGKIEVVSEWGKGTEFSFILPKQQNL